MNPSTNGNSTGLRNGQSSKLGPGVFALVIYVPDPLGRFLDDLRRDLVPHYNPRAHVSVLPPRSLSVEWQIASSQLRALSESWRPFEVELTRIAVFPVTNVIYLELGEGAEELRRMHAKASRALAFDEPFAFHPHVTLAQEILPERVEEMRERAEHLWREYQGPRRFHADRAIFVQSVPDNCWVDLAEYPLGVPVAR
ncbi:MAG TPA: 2'-5' RNA ligase family protein [Bryobacteraceae bacterium]|nr:2'-5' RNA ligase family protein [Bryobacteraceae bacterium]